MALPLEKGENSQAPKESNESYVVTIVASHRSLWRKPKQPSLKRGAVSFLQPVVLFFRPNLHHCPREFDEVTRFSTTLACYSPTRPARRAVLKRGRSNSGLRFVVYNTDTPTRTRTSRPAPKTALDAVPDEG